MNDDRFVCFPCGYLGADVDYDADCGCGACPNCGATLDYGFGLAAYVTAAAGGPVPDHEPDRPGRPG